MSTIIIPEWVNTFLLLGGVVIGSLVLLFGKQVIEWTVRVAAVAIVDQIGKGLEPRWMAAVEAALAPILDELTPNGGTSLRDRVDRLSDRLDDVADAVESLLPRDG